MSTTFILFIVVLLFILAISDLIIGVSNDAVNFLNSAIGSRVAPYRVIILTAIVGIILGSLFSSGIMEIARKGIFYPELFTFDKILFVFLAVMLTDIVLLDIFNTMGLPTSTTVSIVFELLGAALIVGVLMTVDKNGTINDAFKFINFDSTSTIISGIFLSILIAFTAGIVIHYLTRLVFTFDYQANLGKYGALYAGLGLSAIMYFLLIKGLKGTTLLSTDIKAWIDVHTISIIASLFVFNTVVCFVLQRFAKINPLKIVVLAGTFSLAMAFAGNDLVNFIGVPISGFLAFQNWQGSGIAPELFYQDFLASNDVIVPNYMLLIAGIVMALTIWLSAKAKKVTETEVNLSRQDAGEERFKANEVSRNIVKTALRLSNFFALLIPKSISDRYNISFQKSKLKKATKTQDSSAFDLVRASSNLVIASILIAWATSMKLPLSTTYVSFMVAMGSSLADKAWGRESAVYRVAGVLSVIGGWFITAFIAFTVAGLFAFVLYKGGTVGTAILITVVLGYLIVSHINFNKKEKRAKSQTNSLAVLDNVDGNIFEVYKSLTAQFLYDIKEAYNAILLGIKSGDKEVLKNANKELERLLAMARKMQSKSMIIVTQLPLDDIDTREALVYGNDLLIDIAQSTQTMSIESLNYVKNLHDKPSKSFFDTVNEVNHKMNQLFESIYGLLLYNTDNFDLIAHERREVRSFINEKMSGQLQSLQQESYGISQNIFQTTLFLQTRDIQAVLMRIAKLFYYKDNKD